MTLTFLLRRFTKGLPIALSEMSEITNRVVLNEYELMVFAFWDRNSRILPTRKKGVIWCFWRKSHQDLSGWVYCLIVTGARRIEAIMISTADDGTDCNKKVYLITSLLPRKGFSTLDDKACKEKIWRRRKTKDPKLRDNETRVGNVAMARIPKASSSHNLCKTLGSKMIGEKA